MRRTGYLHRATSIVTAGLAAIGLLFTVSAHAMRVDNFVLLDHEGAAHELYYHKDASAIVIMVQGNGCPVVRNALNDFKAVRDDFADQNVQFFMLNSNLQDHRASIQKEAAEWDIDMPILDDETQLIGESLNLVRTGEVLIINPRTWDLVYRGPVNDRLSDYERQKAEASEHYVADVLKHMTTGATVDVAERDVPRLVLRQSHCLFPPVAIERLFDSAEIERIDHGGAHPAHHIFHVRPAAEAQGTGDRIQPPVFYQPAGQRGDEVDQQGILRTLPAWLAG